MLMWYSMPMTEMAPQETEDALEEAQAFFLSMLDDESLIEYSKANPSPVVLKCVVERIQSLPMENRMAISNNEVTPKSVIQQLAKRENNASVLHLLAANPNLPLENLIQLSFHEHSWVRGGAALNINLPTEHVSRLARDKHFEVREFIASHKNLTEKDLILLSNDKEHFVLAAVAANPRLPLRHIKRLSKSKHESVAEVAAENLLWVTVNEYNKKISW